MGAWLLKTAQAWGGRGPGAGSRERRLKRQAAGVHDGFNKHHLYFILEALGSYQKASVLGSGSPVRETCLSRWRQWERAERG